MFKKILLPVMIAFVSFSFSTAVKVRIPGVLHGIVTSEEKVPLNKVHLYTVLGEEETFSNAKGEFSFRINQPSPIKLVVQYEGYEDKVLMLATPEDNLSVVLKRKISK